MEKKLYVIHSARRIDCLNHITGPVETPTLIDPIDVLELVRRGYDIEEVNPYNKKERVKVTQFNFNMITFKTTQTEMIKRKKLNKELQDLDKTESKTDISSSSTKEEKKEEKKKESKKEESSKPQTLPHTDFEKH